MAWEKFTSLDGIYLVDWGAVGKMIRSYVRSQATLANLTVNDEFHWVGPNLHTVDVNWDQVKSQTDHGSESLLAEFYRNAQFNAQNQISRLAHWVEITAHNNAAFHDKMHDAQEKTMENIAKSVGRTQTAINAAIFTRDTSAEFLMVSATIVSGGTAATLAVGGGSFLKATARYEDDVKATKGTFAVTFAAEFAAGMIDVGVGKVINAKAEEAAGKALLEAVGSKELKEIEAEAAKKGVKVSLAILWNHVKGVTVEPAKAVIEGETAQKGLVTGGLKTVGGTHGEILKYLVLDDEKYAKTAAIADTIISIGADKIAESINESNEEKKREGAEGKAPKISKKAHSDHVLLDALAYDRKMIEQMAIRKIGSAGPAIANPSRAFGHIKTAAGFKH